MLDPNAIKVHYDELIKSVRGTVENAGKLRKNMYSVELILLASCCTCRAPKSAPKRRLIVYFSDLAKAALATVATLAALSLHLAAINCLRCFPPPSPSTLFPFVVLD